MRRGRPTQRGSISAFVAIIGIALVMVAGMAYDGGQIVAAHATARDIATSAGRAAAQEIDLTVLRGSGDAHLDAERAVAAAHTVISRAGHDGIVTVDADSVTVAVHVRQPMRILPLPDRTITATHTATALTGPIEEPDGG